MQLEPGNISDYLSNRSAYIISKSSSILLNKTSEVNTKCPY